MSLTFVQGDTAPEIFGVIRRVSNSQPIPLTGCTVRFQMRKKDDRRYTVNAIATIDDEANGAVSYEWGPNDLATPGTYIVQWETTFPGGRQQTTVDETEIYVRRQ